MKKFNYKYIYFFAITITAIIIFFLYYLKPKAKQKDIKKEAKQVEVFKLKEYKSPILIKAFGRAYSKDEVVFSSKIQGRVERVTDNFLPGAFVKKGDVLLKIEDQLYKSNLAQAKANSTLAYKEYISLKKEAKINIFNWQREYPNKSIPLLLSKELELNAAKQKLIAAKKALQEAKNNLDNTIITAPFDGIILKRDVKEGIVLAPGKILGAMYNPYIFNVRFALRDDLSLLIKPGSTVLLEKDQNGDLIKLKGKLLHSEGQIDKKTHMIYFLARFNFSATSKEYMPLLFPQEFLTVKIATQINKVIFKIPLSALLNGERVLIVKDNIAQEKKIKKLYIDGDYVFFQGEVQEGDLLILNPNLVMPNERVETYSKKNKINY